MQIDISLFQALSDPTRLRILALLREMELAVSELAQVLGQSQPRVSKHVKILIDCDLIERRKEGNWAFLAVGEPGLVNPVFTLLDRWAEHHGRNPWFGADKARLTAIIAEREADAANYFKAHAADWDRLRALHVPTADVDAAILHSLGDHRPGRLVDIGTGTGTMLLLFADKAEHMIGLDRSPDMLRFGRAKLAQAGVTNAELRQGDMNCLDLPSGSADTVILHQVLHYARHPAAVVAEAARLLAPGGRLVIVDIAAHDREELRRDHAHARLGFSDEEVVGYLRAAGLDAEVAEHLTGAELTITLWTGQPASARLKAVQ